MNERLAHPNFQPYFVAYALSQGNTPERQSQVDRTPFGTFKGYLFMEWIAAQHAEFAPTARVRTSPAYIADFTSWLAERYASVEAA